MILALLVAGRFTLNQNSEINLPSSQELDSDESRSVEGFVSNDYTVDRITTNGITNINVTASVFVSEAEKTETSGNDLRARTAKRYKYFLRSVVASEADQSRLIDLITEMYNSESDAHSIASVDVRENPNIQRTAVKSVEEEILSIIGNEFGKETQNQVSRILDSRYFIPEVESGLIPALSNAGILLNGREAVDLLYLMKQAYVTRPARKAKLYSETVNVYSGLTGRDELFVSAVQKNLPRVNSTIVSSYLRRKNTESD